MARKIEKNSINNMALNKTTDVGYGEFSYWRISKNTPVIFHPTINIVTVKMNLYTNRDYSIIDKSVWSMNQDLPYDIFMDLYKNNLDNLIGCLYKILIADPNWSDAIAIFEDGQSAIS